MNFGGFVCAMQCATIISAAKALSILSCQCSCPPCLFEAETHPLPAVSLLWTHTEHNGASWRASLRAVFRHYQIRIRRCFLCPYLQLESSWAMFWASQKGLLSSPQLTWVPSWTHFILLLFLKYITETKIVLDFFFLFWVCFWENISKKIFSSILLQTVTQKVFHQIRKLRYREVETFFPIIKLENSSESRFL